MTLGLTDINKVRTENGIASFGMNLEYELQLAAVERGISPNELADMPGVQLWLKNESDFCKADLIVWYRLKQQMEAVGTDLQNKHLVKMQKHSRMGRSGR